MGNRRNQVSQVTSPNHRAVQVYATYAGSYLPRAKKFATRPVKQAVISASAMSLLYPEEGIPDYSREQFLSDLVAEAVADICNCFENGAYQVQIDFIEVASPSS